MSINGCEKLMLRLKNGDMSAFDKIYEQTNQAVFFSALRILRDRVRAEDIMQEVYINLIEKIALYNEGNAIGFLVTMAKRMALNELKRAKREVLTDYSEIDFVDPRAFDGEVGSPLITLAMRVLEEDEFDILSLAEISGYKRKEIAVILHIPISTVTYKYLRAIDKLKKNYEKEERQ